MFLQHLADKLSSGWDNSYGHVLCVDQDVLSLCYYSSNQPLLLWITCALAK